MEQNSTQHRAVAVTADTPRVFNPAIIPGMRRKKLTSLCFHEWKIWEPSQMFLNESCLPKYPSATLRCRCSFCSVDWMLLIATAEFALNVHRRYRNFFIPASASFSCIACLNGPQRGSHSNLLLKLKLWQPKLLTAMFGLAGRLNVSLGHAVPTDKRRCRPSPP